MTKIKTINLSEDDFENSFSLVYNKIRSDAAYEGYAFETFGAELEFLRTQLNSKVWSLIEEDGQLMLISGYHDGFVIYHLVTNEAVPSGVQYIVTWE